MEEIAQLEDNVNWLERRLATLQDSRTTEPDAAAKRFALRSVRIFPAGILYILPQSLIEGAR